MGRVYSTGNRFAAAPSNPTNPVGQEEAMRLIGPVVCLLAGCVNGDAAAIIPYVANAAVEVDRAAPAALARIDVKLDLIGERFTGDTARLVHCALAERRGTSSSWVAELQLDFPDGFDARVGPDELRTVGLVNRGTANRELGDLCERDLDLGVEVARAGEPEVARASYPFALTVRCP
jgi:hypothetical protein